MSIRNKQNSLAFKIGLGFGMVGLILLGALLFTLIEINNTTAVSENLIVNKSDSSTAIFKLLDGLDEVMMVQRTHLNQPTNDIGNLLDALWNNEVLNNYQSLQALSSQWNNALNKNRLSTVGDQLKALEISQKQINQEILNKQTNEAIHLFLKQALPQANDIKGLLTRILVSHQTQLIGAQQDILVRLNRLLFTDWSFLIIGLLLCVILGIILTKSMTKPIISLVESVKQLARGNLDQSIQLTGATEFEELSIALNEMVSTFQNLAEVTGKMAVGDYTRRVKVKSEQDQLAITVNQMLDNFNQIVEQANAIAEGNYNLDITPRSEHDVLGTSLMNMTLKLRDNQQQTTQDNWLKDGIAYLSKSISGKHDVTNVCNSAITTLCRHLNAGVGAIYLYDSRHERLNLMGSYAFRDREALANRFEIGEGIVGQVARERQAITLHNITREQCVISSATTETVPLSIYTFPLIHEKRLIGVAEIAGHDTIDDLRKHYIEQANPIISIQLRAAQQQTLTERLLNESKSLTEKLQIQQEELKATNEELEQQTQVLKASEEELRQKDEQQRAINKQLAERTKELEQQKAEIEAKTQAIQLTRDKLKEKADELEQASAYKSEFLANMSHELRTPLNSLLILAKLLADNDENNLTEDQVESARIMLKSGQDLLTLINDILDLAKVEAGKIELHLGNTELREFVKKVERDFSHVTKEKGIDLVTVYDERLPQYIFTDDQRVGQIIRNLMSNAIKFTERGEVRFSVMRPASDTTFNNPKLSASNTVAIEIRDSGIGIPEEKRESIFESFQQADGTTSRKYGGTGLGLSISLQFANLLGGEINLTSEVGKGSCFTLYLPAEIDQSENASEEAKLIEHVVTPDPEKNQTVEKAVATSSEEVATASLPPSKVPDDRDKLHADADVLLIIEDDLQFTKVLMNLCHKHEFKCLHADNGEHGLQLAKYFKPEGILLDIGLPGMDGLTVLDKLKTENSTKGIPVHIISAGDDSALAFEKGAIGYLTKPVSQEQIELAINKLAHATEKDLSDLLIIEDNPEMLRAMSKLLKNKDIEITGASTGKIALEKIKNKRYGCIILDLGLPDMSGEELLQKIHEQYGDESPAVIIHTGQSLSKSESESLTNYADSIIIKTGTASMERLMDETSLFLHRVATQSSTTQKSKTSPKQTEEESVESEDLEKVDNKFANKVILLVDDDMRNTFALSKSLKSKGMKVLMAANGKTALNVLKENPQIDLVFMDIMMPIMDGFEAISIIRKESAFKKLPIIALTAKAMKGDKEKCLAVGASDFLAKPIDLDKMLTLLDKWL